MTNIQGCNQITDNKTDQDPETNADSSAELLKDILDDLIKLEWVGNAVIIRKDGIVLASGSGSVESYDSNGAVAIMGATIVGAAKNIAAKCQLGFPNRVIIQAEQGDVVITKSGDHAHLICFTNTRYDPHLMAVYLDKAAAKIPEVY